MDKEQVPDEFLRRAVVEDLDPLSASNDVLATSFDNLLRLPASVSLAAMRRLGIDISSNFQTSTALPSAGLSSILEIGWSRA
jgi:hypothetical protein